MANQEVDQESDPVSDEAELEPDERPAEVQPDQEPESEVETDAGSDVETDAAAAPGLPSRLAAASRHALVGLLARLATLWVALVPRLARLTVTIASGLLLRASFPSLNWWWAAIVAAALLAWVLTNPKTTPAGGLGYGFLFGFAFYLPLLPWISGLVGAVPWVVLAIESALFPALFGLFAVVVRRLPGWPLWFALVWTAQEWMKSIFPFGGFPWGSVAFGQADGPFLPLVQLGGTALLSMAIVLVGFSLTAIALETVNWWPTGHHHHPPVDAEAAPDAVADPPVARSAPAVVLPAVCICMALLGAMLVWPQVRHAGAGSGGEPSITVAAVQGNVPRLGLNFNAQRRAVLDNHVVETIRLAEDVRAGTAQQPQFVIWPENSSDIDPLVNADAGQQIAEAAKAIGAPILVGTILEVPPDRPQDTLEFTNTVIVWNPVTGPADRHDKEIVQPFGEYLPMPWLFKHLSAYADRAGHMVPRQGSDVVLVAGVPIGISTCWEVIFDREPRKAVLNGAQLLAVPANNATFDKNMSEQQLAFAKVRAVEHDRYVVVAGTTGISAVIAPDGRELARTEFFEPAYLDTQVRLKTALTPATRWGLFLQWILVAAAGAVILVAIRQNGWFPRPIRLRSRQPDESEESGASPDESEDSGSAGDDGAGKVQPTEELQTKPPENGGDQTPLHRSGQSPRYFGRHRGAK
jgi:apolipoprotein N-acyltransferase